MNSKKKIAYMGIKGLPSKGGAERVVEAIVNNLNEDFDLFIYCSKSYSISYQRDDVKLIKILSLRGKHLSSFSLFVLTTLHALLFKKFDLVHLHNSDAGFIVPILRLKYKVIGTHHGFAYKREKWSSIVKKLLKLSEILFMRYANSITCVSKSLSEEIISIYTRDAVFIPNGIEKPEIIEDPVLFNKHKIKKKGFLCFAAGRVDPTKGCHILLESFNHINRDMGLVAIGDFSHKKDYSEDLYQMADERVRFIPFIEEKEKLFGIIINAKLFVFPSTVEAMSIMLLEVAALGVPIICSDIPENVSVLEDNTIYFRSEDSRDLKEKIEYCLDNYEEMVKKAEKTKGWIIKQYDWETIAKSYKNIYSNIK